MNKPLVPLAGALVRLTLCFLVFFAAATQARDLEQIRQAGVLRHLGVPYANFVTGSGDGLDVELMQGFARHLGVRYEFVETDWQHLFGDLTGRHARRNGKDAELLAETEIRGDVIANGLTILGWRQQVVDYSEHTFPSGVWLIARADSPLRPITPSGQLVQDILQVKQKVAGHSVLALASTCLDPGLYRMEETGADVRMQPPGRKLNEMVPAILRHDAESTLLDVPDALIALERWPGQIKVIGPISDQQFMGAGFRKDSPNLRKAFNEYLAKVRADGTYNEMVRRYYPAVFRYFSTFFDT